MWKDIPAEVGREMEKYLKSGILYPTLPPGKDKLPKGVFKSP